MKVRIITLIETSVILFAIFGIIACEEEKEDDFFPENEPDLTYETYSDTRDGQTYKYIQIGTQIWMAENLNYDTISSWVYDNNSSNAVIYGRLYAWETACKVCPDGWHLPDSGEYGTLINYLGGPAVAGGGMKRTGTTYWNYPNTGATNTSGFSALPGGLRRYYDGGWFDCIGDFAGFWTNSEYEVEETALFMSLSTNGGDVGSSFSVEHGLDWCRKAYGRSVRCIRD